MKMKISMKEFYRILGQLRKAKGWQWTFSPQIRGTYKYENFCPLTGVVKRLTKKTFGVMETLEAGRTIGLREREINKIIDSSDTNNNNSGYVYDDYSEKTHKKLIQALGEKVEPQK